MSDQPRIDVLFAIPRLGGGGAERVVATLLRHIDRDRFQLSLALQDQGGEYMDEIPTDVEILDLGPGRLRNRLPRLLALAWRRRPGILFTTQGYVNLLAATVRPLLPPGTRLVARETSIPGRRLGGGLEDRIKAWLYRRRLSNVDRLVCQCQDMREEFVGTWGFPADRVTVIHNPVDVDRVRTLAAEHTDDVVQPGGHIQLVAAGRLVPQKGFDLLLDALGRTPDRYHLTIFGDGPEREALARHASDLGLSARVRFVPYTPNPYPHMSRADAVVLSSLHEGFPNVLLEAGACGTPALAFRCPGGIDEILIEGETGFLVDPGDVDGLAGAIAGERYLAMDSVRIEASIRDRFAPEVIVPMYEDLLVGMASGGGLGRC